jgi:hypothetical protein
MPAGEQREGQRIVLGNIDTNTDISPWKPRGGKGRSSFYGFGSRHCIVLLFPIWPYKCWA